MNLSLNFKSSWDQISSHFITEQQNYDSSGQIRSYTVLKNLDSQEKEP